MFWFEGGVDDGVYSIVVVVDIIPELGISYEGIVNIVDTRG